MGKGVVHTSGIWWCASFGELQCRRREEEKEVVGVQAFWLEAKFYVWLLRFCDFMRWTTCKLSWLRCWDF